MDKAQRDAAILRLRDGGKTYDEIADALNITRGIVAGVVYRNKPDKLHPSPPERLETLQVQNPNITTDARAWDKLQARIERDNRFIVVAHDSDTHFPYHDPLALRARYMLLAMAQPHIIVTGSDAGDFPNIKPKFDPDPRIPAGQVLTRFEKYWKPHVQAMHQAAPDAALVWIDGNHDEGMWLALERNENADILMRFFVDTIRADGLVHWRGVGMASLEVEIAKTLIVTHGTKATKHSASGMLDLYNRQYYVMAGHTHRPDYYGTTARYEVEACIGGCACQLMPHYERRKTRTAWRHGMAIATVDTHSKRVHFDNVVFKRDGYGGYWFKYADEIVTVTASGTIESEAAA